MKLKEKLNQAAGFTLVELIVVIAILAILAGIAVPVYSGYINKANQQADLTMISEIKDILTLGYYSGDLTESGHIILSTDGVVNADSISTELAKALADAYGTNWATSLKLKYDEWTTSPAFGTLTKEAANAVMNSSFVTGSTPSVLMESVSTLTNSMASALGNKEDSVQAIKNNVSGDSIAAVEEKLGVSIDDLSDTELSNFALLVVADEMSQATDLSQSSVLVQLVTNYALYSGYAYSNFATEEERTAYENMNNTLANAATADLTGYNGSYAAYALDQINIFANTLDSEKLEEYGENNSETDMSAVMTMMEALNQGSSNLKANDLSNPSLATEGVVGEYFNQYIDAAEVLAAIGADINLSSGEVAVCFSAVDSILIFSTVD